MLTFLLFVCAPWARSNAMSYKAIKYRIYPTTEQENMFAKTFGCCRKI